MLISQAVFLLDRGYKDRTQTRTHKQSHTQLTTLPRASAITGVARVVSSVCPTVRALTEKRLDHQLFSLGLTRVRQFYFELGREGLSRDWEQVLGRGRKWKWNVK